MSTEPEATNWRERLKLVGKAAYVREEMIRLGFWPPDEETARKAETALAELKIREAELAILRKELAALDKEFNVAKDIPALISEIRKRRIERVRAEREVKRIERLRQAEDRRQQDRQWRQKTLPFLGRGVSGGLRYEGDNPAKVAELGLPALGTAEDVAAAIGIEPGELAWLTYHRQAAVLVHYHRFSIPKKRGGTRSISAPKKRLRTAQSWLYAEILSKVEIHAAAMAFRPQRSIVDNGERHTGKAVVVKVDLKDFFPSIKFRRVKGVFRSFGYNEGVATLLALLATEPPRAAVTLDGERRFVAVGERQLPQGACTSPSLTNILCRQMDCRLTGAAQSMGFVYTRYADDLVFSHADASAPVGMLLTLLREIIDSEGFTLHEEKTAVMRPQHRQAVTGLVVNTKPHVSREDLRRFRAFLHQCETKGTQVMSERIGKDAVAYAAGYLSFLHMVAPEQEEKIQRTYPWLTRWQKPSKVI
jgi:RNA-directed DNA polymerase